MKDSSDASQHHYTFSKSRSQKTSAEQMHLLVSMKMDTELDHEQKN